MSLHYILDGYNIIHQLDIFSKGSLQDQRERLINYLDNKRPQGSFNNQVTVVFDGKSEFYGSSGGRTVKVIFSSDEPADEKIKRLVSGQPKQNIIVVTNDREIQYYVRSLGAKVLSVADFFTVKSAVNEGNVYRKKNKAVKDQKNISAVDESKITQELQQVWLKKNKS